MGCVGGGFRPLSVPSFSHSDIKPVAGSPRGAVSHSLLVPCGQDSWLKVTANAFRRLAADLQITKGSFYWHFKDREDLHRAMLDYWARPFMAINRCNFLIRSNLRVFRAAPAPASHDII
jgi:hypothetical protein